MIENRSACRNHRAVESAVKCLSKGHITMSRVDFNRNHVDHKHGASTTRSCGRHLTSNACLKSKKMKNKTGHIMPPCLWEFKDSGQLQ